MHSVICKILDIFYAINFFIDIAKLIIISLPNLCSLFFYLVENLLGWCFIIILLIAHHPFLSVGISLARGYAGNFRSNFLCRFATLMTGIPERFVIAEKKPPRLRFNSAIIFLVLQCAWLLNHNPLTHILLGRLVGLLSALYRTITLPIIRTPQPSEIKFYFRIYHIHTKLFQPEILSYGGIPVSSIRRGLLFLSRWRHIYRPELNEIHLQSMVVIRRGIFLRHIRRFQASIPYVLR